MSSRLLIIAILAAAGCSSRPTPVVAPAPTPQPFVEIDSRSAEVLRSLAAEQNFGDDWSVRLEVVWREEPEIEVTLEKKPPGKDDHVLQADGLRVVMANDQKVYLKGARIRYFKVEQGAGFDVTFPNRDERDIRLASEWYRTESAKRAAKKTAGTKKE